MSLRARLLLAVLSLAAAGLLVAGGVTYALLNSFLTSRVDQQLVEAALPTSHLLNDAASGRTRELTGSPGPRGPLPPGTYAALVDGQGVVTYQLTFGFTSSQQSARPQLPGPAVISQARLPLLFTAPGTNGEKYRVVIARAEGSTQNRVVVAVPLTDVESTLRRLLLLEVGVGIAVLLGLAALGNWAVRLGLRPLDHIAGAAGEIAAGDLQRRVSPATSRTEIGRLGLALNAMLAKIEEAFAAQRRSEERLRRFVADASHELRTPVASIRGYAELFRRGAAAHPDDLAMTMRRIEDEAGRMGHLVEDLLLLARLDEGRPLEREPVDLGQLAADAAADARATDTGRSIQALVGDDAIVAGDEQRLRQVVANLMRNALVHTPAGTPIEISTEVAGEFALLRVVDHGGGIAPEAIERIFERFYRVDPARARDTGSSGLGLSIVAAVVAAHGGTVSVSSTPNGGATFIVRLPRYPGATTPTAPAPGRENKSVHIA